MKKILFSSILLFFCAFLQSQELEEVGKISLSVVMPENVEKLDVAQLSKLESKIIQITTRNGLGGKGYTHNFVIYPKFDVYETNRVEGGMKNLYVSECELSLFIKQVDERIIFSSISIPLTGSGYSKAGALANAIRKINVKDNDVQQFIERGKTKIINYYNLKCESILESSDRLKKMQKYEEAIGLMLKTPSEVDCYSKILEKSIEIYQAFENQLCSREIQQVKLIVAGNRYYPALRLLNNIDPYSSCFPEAERIIRDIENKIDKEERIRWERERQIYQAELDLEKERINLEKYRIKAMKERAISYYGRNQPKHNYNVVIQ